GEGAGAGDQVEEAAVGRAEDAQRGEAVEGQHLEGVDAEGQLPAVGVRHVDPVARMQQMEIAEDGRALDAVEVPVDHRLTGSARLHPGSEPRGVPEIPWNVHQTARRCPDGFNQSVDAQGRNAYPIRRDRAVRGMERRSKRPDLWPNGGDRFAA